MCTYAFVYHRVRMVACYSDSDPLVRPDPIRISPRYGSDTLAIQRPIHEMIWRFIPVHAVKAIRRFGFKIASFHVSVYSCVFSYYSCQ